METLNEKLQSLRSDIDDAFANDEVTRNFVKNCNARAASLLVAAASMDGHPIHVELETLKEAVSTAGLAKTYWVGPHFHSSIQQRRKHSHLQFLLLITLRAPLEWKKLMHLADTGSIPSQKDLEALDKCRDTFMSSSVDDLTPEVWLRHLLKALGLLHDPGAVYRLDGDTLTFPNGQSLQLKQGRLVLMRMLLEAPDHRVKHEDLHAENVNNPTRVLSELRMRLL